MSSYRSYWITGIILSVLGWGGWIYVVGFTYPTLFPRWLFYFLFVIALCGTSLPVIAFLHWRFPSKPPAEGNVLVRESIWVGIFGSVVMWLQQGRVLNPALFLFLAVGFILIETLLRLRERSRWNPKGRKDE